MCYTIRFVIKSILLFNEWRSGIHRNEKTALSK